MNISKKELKALLQSLVVSKKKKTEALCAFSHIRKGRRWFTLFSISNKPTSHLIWKLYRPYDPILKGEVIHHKNENKLDDRFSNYEKITKKEHDALHQDKTIEAMRQANLGRECLLLTRNKIGDANRNRKHSVRSRINMSESHLGNTASIKTKSKMSITQRERRAAQMKWNPKEALKLRESGMSQRKIGVKLGVHYSAMFRYFKLREVKF